MGVWLGPRGANGEGKAPLFTITKNGSPATLGTDYLYAENTVNGVVHWEMAVLTNCVVNFSRVGKVDLFILGGGSAGWTGQEITTGGYPDAYGGDGGNGGKINTVTTGVSLTKNNDYAVTIGGSGADTIGFGYSSATNTSGQKAGGDGARSYGNAFGQSHDAVQGTDGEYAFGSSTSLISALSGRKYAAGGGGGGCKNSTYYVPKSSAYGGATGGGTGGSSGDTDGTAGEANTGSGGGGGYTFGSASDGSAGGSGILIVRDHRG